MPILGLILLGVIDTSFLSILALGSSLVAGIIAWRKIGPERTATVVGYQGEVIEDLHEDNERLRTENRRLRDRVRSLEDRVGDLEQTVRQGMSDSRGAR